MQDNQQTHFGYNQVDVNEKEKLVKGVFDSVASQYDLMNDVMSFGMHRFWKSYVIHIMNVKENDIVLDLAGGTGDLALSINKSLSSKGQVILADINKKMLEVACHRQLDQQSNNKIINIQANAENLPFRANSFDKVLIVFGLRNVTDKQKALKSMLSVLKPGGSLYILEFSKPIIKTFAKIYDKYSFEILPKMGEVISSDRESYQYLAESIRKHPDQSTLADMLTIAGFDQVDFYNLTAGIVAIHRGIKY